MRALDTNVLVRALVRDDLVQARRADEFIASGAWVSLLVLAETVWVLGAVYERRTAQIIALLEVLLAHESLVLQDADTVAAALTSFKAKPKLGFSDCLVVEIARKAGHTPIGTFDKALAKLPGTENL